MSATLLQMVNRVRRKLKWEDVSSFAANDDLTTVLIDCINEAKRDVLENYEHDNDIRSDGIFKTIAPYSYTSTLDIDNGSSTLTAVSQNDYAAITGGSSRSRARITSDTTYGDTAFIILTGRHPTTSDSYVLETTWPGTTFDVLGTMASGEILTAEYVLPTTVRDVLSVMVEESDVYVEFVDKSETLDQCVPSPFDLQSTQPEVCFVGGSTTPTVTFGTTATPGLGIWLYPVPASVYVVRYTYRYRHPALSATTDTLYVEDHIIDYIVNLALAFAHRSRIAPDLEAAQTVESVTRSRLERSVRRSGRQPLERTSLRSHDRRGGGIPLGGKARNPRIFYQP